MKSVFGFFLLLAGAVLGAAATHTLHAQSGPTVYAITEVDVTNPAGYEPMRTALTKETLALGGVFLSQGGKFEVIDGPAPRRIVVVQWKSMADAKKYYASPVVKKAFEDRKPHVKNPRVFIVEGVAN